MRGRKGGDETCGSPAMDARQLIRWHDAVHTRSGGDMLLSDTGGGGPGVVGRSNTVPSFSSSSSAAATSF